MAELIAAQTAQADSADIALASGSSTTFLLKGGSSDVLPANSVALLQAKSGTQYVTIGQIDSANPIKVLTATGTFRVRKLATSAAVGVDRD